jgi:hypothetical protein
MRVILRRPIPNALELAAANAHDRHAHFIMKLRITFHLQRTQSMSFVTFPQDAILPPAHSPMPQRNDVRNSRRLGRQPLQTDLHLRDFVRLRSCLLLCFFGSIICHQHSDLMLDRNRRRKTEFASEPKRIHLELLCSSGLMNLSAHFLRRHQLLHRWGASGISQENRQRS